MGKNDHDIGLQDKFQFYRKLVNITLTPDLIRTVRAQFRSEALIMNVSMSSRKKWSRYTSHLKRRSGRVARWFLFKSKIQICVNFRGSSNGGCWYILCPFGQFFGHLAYVMAIWYIFRPFNIHINGHLVYSPPFWYVMPRKIWQPLVRAKT
jgi:hypothetical protein